MSEFDSRAREWDLDMKHIDRAAAIAEEIKKRISFKPGMKALEYGAGTGLLSFNLRDRFTEIVLMDNSSEMIKVCHEKVAYYGALHMKPLLFDLEQHDYHEKFDIIYSQMVLHHVNKVELLLNRFYDLLNAGGYLVIADLYAEDGSFHGPEVPVHRGFDPDKLINDLAKKGFTNGSHSVCFQVKRENGREYPVFLLIASRK
jgi:2-polyprenyl-3-methyl-5-hydroxy-6-metoxy-1,4-benzoquinol methylase